MAKKYKFDKLHFGSGGIPLTTKDRSTLNGIKRAMELGLNHMELEFVYSVYLKEPEAKEVKKFIKENDFSLSVHGSYYTNLAADDEKKYHASIYRLVKAAEMGEMAGAESVTFHTGFFQGKTVEEIFPRITKGLTKAMKQLEEKGVKDIKISPELTGKPSQFGSIEELVKLIKYFRGQKEVDPDRVRMCIDFAHNHARANGIFKTKDEYKKLFDYLLKELGEHALKDLHMHMSAIEYSAKGERNHLTMLKNYAAYEKAGVKLPEIKRQYREISSKKLGGGEQDWQGLMEVLKEYEVTGYIVCESPNLEHDAMLMQKYYNQA